MFNQLLHYAVLSGWVLFAFYLIICFTRSTLERGLRMGLVQFLSFKRFCLPLLVLLTFNCLSSAFVFIQPNETAIVISLFKKGTGLRDNRLKPGANIIVPFFEKAVIYPISIQAYTMASRPYEGDNTGDDSITARTSDGQEVKIDCTILFKIDPERVVDLHIYWQDRYTENLLRPYLRGQVRSFVSKYTVDQVNSDKRDVIENFITDNLGEELKQEGISLERFILRNIGFSKDYSASVEQKQVAYQGMTQKEYEANQIRNLAVGEADRIIQIAQAEAQAVRIKAQAEAEARVALAEADKQALELVSPVVAKNPRLLSLRYIQKINPNVKVMLIPEHSNTILSMPSLADDLGSPSEKLDFLGNRIADKISDSLLKEEFENQKPKGSEK